MIPIDASELMAPLGVTRLAEVTGLDRAGIDVVCAIRPFGHVLQVCNGKGATARDATLSALGEASELHAAESPDYGRMIFGSSDDMNRWGLSPAPLEHCGEIVAEDLAAPSLRMGWVPAENLLTGDNVFVPAPAVHCVSQDDPPIGPPIYRWTSNGMGAHPVASRALLHALFEAVERDQLAKLMPDGWTEELIAARMLKAPIKGVLPLVAQLESRGFEIYLFDLYNSGEYRLPLAAALLVDREDGPIPVTAGYACRKSYQEAFTAAIYEAAQSRLTDIHGAREDVDHSGRKMERELAKMCRRIRGTRQGDPTFGPRTDEAAIQIIRGGLNRNCGGAYAAWLRLPIPQWYAVRVVLEGFRVSELL